MVYSNTPEKALQARLDPKLGYGGPFPGLGALWERSGLWESSLARPSALVRKAVRVSRNCGERSLSLPSWVQVSQVQLLICEKEKNVFWLP